MRGTRALVPPGPVALPPHDATLPTRPRRRPELLPAGAAGDAGASGGGRDVPATVATAFAGGEATSTHEEEDDDDDETHSLACSLDGARSAGLLSLTR